MGTPLRRRWSPNGRSRMARGAPRPAHRERRCVERQEGFRRGEDRVREGSKARIAPRAAIRGRGAGSKPAFGEARYRSARHDARFGSSRRGRCGRAGPTSAPESRGPSRRWDEHEAHGPTASRRGRSCASADRRTRPRRRSTPRPKSFGPGRRFGRRGDVSWSAGRALTVVHGAIRTPGYEHGQRP